MPDALSPADKFAKRGLTFATKQHRRSIKIGETTYYGVRTEVVVTQGDAQYGGRKTQRGFEFCGARADFLGVPKEGGSVKVVDDVGGNWVVANVKFDAVHVMLTCVGKWG